MTSAQRMGALAGAFSLLVCPIQAAIPLDIGTTYSGNIALPGETHTFAFSGTPGRRLYLDTQDADNLLINLTLTSPAGMQVFQRNDDYDYGPFVLNESGTYSLVVSATGSTTGNYQFRLLDLAAAPSLTLGSTLSGQLTPPLACNIYQFNGKRGQRINLQSVSSFSNLAQWQLVSPANVVLASGYVYQNLGVLTLPADGPYCLMVSGYSQGVPAVLPCSFQVLLTDVSDIPVTASGFGTPHSGTVNANQTNSFIYTAPAGLPVYFDSLDASGQSLVVSLTDPASNTVIFANETSDTGPYVLPRSGTYTLNVWGPNGTSGNFNFRLLDLTTSPALAINTVVSNSLDSPYETDVYQFTGTTGQRLYYDTLANLFANVQFRILAPDGQTPVSVYQSYDAGPFSLSYGGPYYFFVQSGLSASAFYAFELFDVASQPPLPINLPLTGSLGANASALYQLAGTAGERLFFNGETVSTYGASWTLYDPQNGYVPGGNSALNGDFGVTLPYTGNYVLAISAGASSVSFSNYVSTFAYQTNAISFATPASNNIVNPGVLLVYTFSGTAGHKLFFDSLLPSSSIYFSLYSPTGLQTAYGNASSDVGPFSLIETGTYTLIFSASGDTTGPLSFQLLDVNTQPVVPLNVDFTGSLQTNASFIYQLAGTNGEQLYFRGKAPVSGAYWTLYDPRNAQIGSANVGGDFSPPLTLPFTGNYTLVFSANSWPANYTNQINTFTYFTNNLTFGTLTTNNVLNPGDQLVYTFTGTAGQRVYYDSLFPGYFPMTVTLVAPSGAPISYGNASYDLGPVTLLQSGTYTLTFTPSGNTTGGVYFRLLDIALQAPLPLNTDFSGTLASNSSLLYQLAGTPGEQLYFNSEGGFAGSANWLLFAPNNTQIGNSYLGGDFELTLPYSGSYVLVLMGGPSDVSYTNQVNTFSYTSNALTLGNTVTSAILKPGNQLYYTFTGHAGQRLYYDSRITNYFSAYVNLISPGGSTIQLGNASYDQGPFTLTQSGTYTLVFDGVSDTTGILSFQLLDLSAASPISLGSTITDSLSDQTQTRLYKFAGTIGQRLNLHSLTSSGTTAIWTLFNLTDQSLGLIPYISGDIGVVTLPVTGNYIIAVIGETMNASPLDYQFTVSDISDSAVSAGGLGSVNSGNIAANQTNSFTFTAPAGLPIFFDNQDTSGQSLLIDILNPDGTLFTRFGETADAGAYVLPRSGTYTVNVWAVNGASGNYSFRILDMSATPVLPLNTPISGTLTNSYETDIYRLTSSSGQQLIYNALANDPNYPSVLVNFLDPRGQLIGPNTDFANSSGAPFTIQYPGTSYLLLRNTRTVASSYSFQMLDVAAQTSLSLNVSLTNNLGVYPLGVYKFSGTAGQQLYFRGSSGNPNGYWSLFDPNNLTVSGSGVSLYGDFEVTLPVTGTYVLMQANSSTSSGTEIFQVSDYSYFTNSYSIGATVVDAINRPGERRFYTFTGIAGQQLYYDALSDAPAYPNTITATLFNPAGVAEGPIGGIFSADRGPFTLQNSGTYTLAFDGSGSGVGPLAFRLLDIAAQPPFPLNIPVTNNLGVYPSIVYRYAGTAGQQLYFRGQPNNPNGYWTLYDPNNFQLYGSGANLSGDFEVTLPMNGTYTLVLYNYSTTAGPEIFEVNDFAYFTNSYTIGTVVVDSINRPGARRAYTFTGTVGQKLYYDALTNAPPSPNNISAVLLNPQGTPEGPFGGGFYTDRGPFTLQQSGTYTLVIDGYSSSVGSIAFRLLDVGSQQDLPLNTLVTNTLDLYPAIVYRYSGTAGQQLYFRGQSTNPGGAWTLYDPNDYQVPGGAANLYGDFQVNLPINGLYTLVFINYGNAGGAETFEVSPFNFGETLQVNRTPVLTFIPDQITGEGTTPLLFTAQAADLDGNTLSFTLDPGAPAGASIDSASGLFSWTPPPTGFSFVTNVTVRVTDNGAPPLSVAQTVTISVIAGPVMITAHKTTASATVFWRSAPGKHYQLYYKNSLDDSNWPAVGSVVAATDFISSVTDNTVGNNGIRYYRVQLLDPSP